jgi:hypothetical protein
MRSWMLLVSVLAGLAASSFACTGEPPDIRGTAADAATDMAEGGLDQSSPSADAGADAGKICHRDDPWGRADLLAGVNVGQNVFHPRLTADELEIYYQAGGDTVLRATRAARELPFGDGSVVVTTDAGLVATDPAISGNNLHLYVSLGARIARLSRASRVAPFGEPVFLELGAAAGVSDSDAHVLANEGALYFARNDPAAGGTRIWRATGDGDGGYSPPAPVALGDEPYHNPAVSDDELEIYVAHGATNTMRRAVWDADAGAFPTPASVDEINSQTLGGGNARPGWISLDGCRHYFASGTSLSLIYLAERTPR